MCVKIISFLFCPLTNEFFFCEHRELKSKLCVNGAELPALTLSVVADYRYYVHHTDYRQYVSRSGLPGLCRRTGLSVIWLSVVAALWTSYRTTGIMTVHRNELPTLWLTLVPYFPHDDCRKELVTCYVLTRVHFKYIETLHFPLNAFAVNKKIFTMTTYIELRDIVIIR